MIALASADVAIDVVHLVHRLEDRSADVLGLLDGLGPVRIITGTGLPVAFEKVPAAPTWVPLT